MILTNLGIGTIENNLLKYSSTQVFVFKITSNDGQTLEGNIAINGYSEVLPPGQAPWTVKMGFAGTTSQTATVSGITAKDAVLSTIVVYPQPPNPQPHMLVNYSGKAETE